MPILDHTADEVRVQQRLRDDLIAWLGSVREDGRPHLVPVWFLWDGAVIFILSQPETQKMRNLSVNPRVTIGLDDTRGGKEVVIVEGTAELLDEPAAEAVPAAYLEKYAALLGEMEWPGAEMLADYSRIVRVRPTRIVRW